MIRGGTYRLTEPLVFGPEDSGSETFGITYTNYPGEQPIISGGRVIKGWTEDNDGTWSTLIPDVKAGKWKFRQLFINGRRATRARHPNEGYFRIEKAGEDRRTEFRFKPGDVPACQDLSDVELVFLHDWSITRVPVKSIDLESHNLTVLHQIGGPARWATIDWFEKHPRYFLENSSQFLDAPGEWYLDTKTGVLTYKPLLGQSLTEIEAVAPIAQQLLVVRGNTKSNRYVKNLNFVGLIFEHAGWLPKAPWAPCGDGVYWGRQACTWWSPGTKERARPYEPAAPAAVHFEMAESCCVKDCRVAHVGPSAVWFSRLCRNNRVSGCTIIDVGANGVMIGEGAWRLTSGKSWWQSTPQDAAMGNIVKNNLIEHCGQELFGAVGVWVGLAGQTTISHNEIRHLPYTGVSVGWMWWDPRQRAEPRETPCRANMVIDNHIHHVMQVLSDGGGIYTLGLQPGSVLRGNVIHDILRNAGRAESNGMFLDQGSGDLLIEKNVIYNVDRSPLRFHKGWENLVRQNVLSVRKNVPAVRYNDTKAERIRLMNNTIIEIDSGEAKALEKAVTAALDKAGLEPRYRKKLLGI